MTARFKVSIPDPWRQTIRERQQPIADAAVAALRETARISVQAGRQNIASAGHFGLNWQRDLQFRMQNETSGGLASLDATAIIFHKSSLAPIFETGKTIQGKPLLWIPLNPGMPSLARLRRQGKRLTFATVHGTPLAFDADDRDRHRRPLFFGVPSARIRKIWRITEIVQENVALFASVFRRFFFRND